MADPGSIHRFSFRVFLIRWPQVRVPPRSPVFFEEYGAITPSTPSGFLCFGLFLRGGCYVMSGASG